MPGTSRRGVCLGMAEENYVQLMQAERSGCRSKIDYSALGGLVRGNAGQRWRVVEGKIK